MKKNVFLFLVWILVGCTRNPTPAESHSAPVHYDTLKYATGFSIAREGAITYVTVKYPYQGAKSGHTYILVPRDQQMPEHPPEEKVIHIPVTTIACTSTTHVPLLDYLEETDKLIGFPSTDLVSSKKTRSRIDEGKIKDLGTDKGLNLELLASIHPEMLMGYTMSSDYGQFKKIEELGIPVVINSEYLEKHPLGRAEWIKFVAVFFGKEKQADSLFNMIEKNYNETVMLAKQAKQKPTVLSGIMYGDAWFLPGGQNYASTIFRDASCEYLWASDSTNGYLELSFEAVYQKAHKCDLWIGVGTYSTREQLATANKRYQLFHPFSAKMIYNYDKRMGAKGGNEFLELGYLRPDLILKDLVKIGHPELLPGHELFFYRRLE
jgi:iron complex transport system substrate-binding protein